MPPAGESLPGSIAGGQAAWQPVNTVQSIEGRAENLDLLSWGMAGLNDEVLELLDPHPDPHSLFVHYNQLYFEDKLGACSGALLQKSQRCTFCETQPAVLCGQAGELPGCAALWRRRPGWRGQVCMCGKRVCMIAHDWVGWVAGHWRCVVRALPPCRPHKKQLFW